MVEQVPFFDESPRAALRRLTAAIAYLEQQRVHAVRALRRPSEPWGHPATWREIGELSAMTHEGARLKWGKLV